MTQNLSVIPAKAGIQTWPRVPGLWIPAFAGVTQRSWAADFVDGPVRVGLESGMALPACCSSRIAPTAKTRLSAIQERIINEPPVGAAIGNRRAPAKARI